MSACPACGLLGKHTGEECVARRPWCHVEDCSVRTCIQAMNNGCEPTCMKHYFDDRIVVKAVPVKSIFERLLGPDVVQIPAMNECGFCSRFTKYLRDSEPQLMGGKWTGKY